MTGLEWHAQHSNDAFARNGAHGFVASWAYTNTETLAADTPCIELTAMEKTGKLPRHSALYDATLIQSVARTYADDLRCFIARVGGDGLTFPNFDGGA